MFQVETIRAVLQKELNIPLIEIADQSARLDGGDVLFTGDYCAARMLRFNNI